MIGNVTVELFAPLFLSIDRVGPFQDRMEEFDFTDSDNEPCNAYLMVSKNGRGKTTVMELMAAMMNMLGRTECSSLGIEDLDRGLGRAQWDVKVTLNTDGRRETVILSLMAGVIGEETSLKFWHAEDLQTHGASAWHRLGFVRAGRASRYAAVGKGNRWVSDFGALIDSGRGERLRGFESDSLTFPTLIYFSAYRNIVRLDTTERTIVEPRDWNYQPVHMFDIEGQDWRSSLDNLLVWLKWLDDGRFEDAVQAINERVFKVGDPQLDSGKRLKGVRKEPPEAIVVAGGREHRLDRLSSGEKSLVQLYLRLGSHMTRSTIVLIDEPEVHLHRNLQYETLFELLGIAKKNYPHVCVFMATHSERLMKAFALDQVEENLIKGAYIIETSEEEARAEEISAAAEKD
ncbi:AAA family ATPase [Sphaerotilus sp.]|uniref:AAA family ATPase n=1 Tax=Sphaerotilus sp. TaxID=2093942 RepID=UPI0025D40A84|nr:AAA family ATPase [Sphaerotilus sp.]